MRTLEQIYYDVNNPISRLRELPTKQELLKQCQGYMAFNKTIAPLMGHKTMTRRVISNQDDIKLLDNYFSKDRDTDKYSLNKFIQSASKYQVGSIYWGREPVKVTDYIQNEHTTGLYFEYLSDGKKDIINYDKRKLPKWITKKQGVPNGCTKEMARYFYRVTSVRVERLQDITTEDVLKEMGMSIKDISNSWSQHKLNCEFTTLWNPTSKKGVKDWDSNPYVWVIEYEKVEYIK